MNGHDEIPEDVKEKMNVFAAVIDNFLNEKGGPKAIGFALLVFPFGDNIDSRVSYISNAERADMICMMKELLARFEGRVLDEVKTPQ